MTFVGILPDWDSCSRRYGVRATHQNPNRTRLTKETRRNITALERCLLRHTRRRKSWNSLTRRETRDGTLHIVVERLQNQRNIIFASVRHYLAHSFNLWTEQTTRACHSCWKTGFFRVQGLILATKLTSALMDTAPLRTERSVLRTCPFPASKWSPPTKQGSNYCL